MARQVVWSYPASADFLKELQYLSEHSAQGTRSLYQEAQRATESLTEFPVKKAWKAPPR